MMRIQRTLDVRFGPLMLCIVALFTSLAADTASAASELRVEETNGAVKLQLQNKWQTPSKGMSLTLPAVVSTGEDGSISLRQDDTTVSVASNTALEFYADAESGSLLQRVVQNQGSAFYDVAPRSSSKLRVETPYLVAVIKGTEFDVTIADETTSVALFEGQLQIEALDIAEVVQLVAGQIARRHKNDPHITILNMEDGEPVAQSDARTDAQSSDSKDSDPKSGDGVDATSTVTTRIEDTVGDLDASIGVDAGVGVGAAGVDVGVKTSVGLADGSLGAELNLSAELLATPLELDVGLDTSLGDTELDVDLAAGDLTLDVGADLGLGDTGIDVDLGAGDLTLDVGADLGLGDTGIDVDLGAGDVTLDLGADDGTLDVELDLGIDEVPVVEVEISADTVVDLVPDLRDLLGL
jgi:hypothetical protein